MAKKPGPIEHRDVRIADIILSEKNPRQITDIEFEKLKTSISNDPDFFHQRPPLLNEVKGKLYCYAGHMRIRAAKAIGRESIPAFIQKDVPEKLQDERMIRDNTHQGVWDTDILTSHWDTDAVKDWGVRDFNFNVQTDLLQGPESEGEAIVNHGKQLMTGDNNANFSVVMSMENKKKLTTVLNDIKAKKALEEVEHALMHLVNSYHEP